MSGGCLRRGACTTRGVSLCLLQGSRSSDIGIANAEQVFNEEKIILKSENMILYCMITTSLLYASVRCALTAPFFFPNGPCELCTHTAVRAHVQPVLKRYKNCTS